MEENNLREEEDDNSGIVDELVEPLIEKATTYGKTSLKLIKLKAVQRASVMAPAIITKLITIILMSLFLLVLTIAVAIWLGDMLGKMYYGFFIVAGFYLLLVLCFQLFFKKGMKRSLGDWIVSEILQ
jgi:hypothetical protein